MHFYIPSLKHVIFITRKYFIYSSVRIQHDNNTASIVVSIYKNGSAVTYMRGTITATYYTYPTFLTTTVLELDGVDDYVQIYVHIPDSRYVTDQDNATYFGGYALNTNRATL